MNLRTFAAVLVLTTAFVVVVGTGAVHIWFAYERESARLAQRPLMPELFTEGSPSRAVLSGPVGSSEGGAQGVRSGRSPLESLPWIRLNSGGRSLPDVYEVTAYSHGCTLPRDGRERPPQRAANGRWPVADHTAAADTSLHPFGSEVLIEGVGFRTVGDRGHAIKGRRLDLFVDTCKEARRFGRRFLRVFPVPEATTRVARMEGAE